MTDRIPHSCVQQPDPPDPPGLPDPHGRLAPAAPGHRRANVSGVPGRAVASGTPIGASG
ncbi:hypothetical protein [Streptomyces lancefieldiae]|uniref:Uncharacterized protein n=1 Tax=Streptomyces lancefieldiae TaxID=3075520 RepID=A0ABU3ATX8_9ACTN|nr:hypothetical protein [Streptomyces sp. DSM 40712]MDT0613632.1 hypothetical protein [Streptomyces sp. DSM 40712]